MTAASEKYRVVEDPDLRITTETRDKPCRECGDREVEVRAREGERTEVRCLTCGLLRGYVYTDATPIATEPSENGRSARNEEIRALRAAGIPIGEIARRFAISPDRVTQISYDFPEVMPRRGARRYGPEDVVAALREYRDEHGYWPDWTAWGREHRKPSGSVVVRCFRSWSAALDAAGRAEEWKGLLDPSRDGNETRPEADTRTEDIRAMRDAGIPVSEIAAKFRISGSRVYQITRRAERYKERPGAQRYDSDDVVRAFVAYREERGRWPSRHDWKTERRKPSYSVVARLFGSWSAALTAAKREDAEAA